MMEGQHKVTSRRQLAQRRNWALYRLTGMYYNVDDLWSFCNPNDVLRLRKLIRRLECQIPKGYRRQLKALNKELSKQV